MRASASSSSCTADGCGLAGTLQQQQQQRQAAMISDSNHIEPQKQQQQQCGGQGSSPAAAVQAGYAQNSMAAAGSSVRETAQKRMVTTARTSMSMPALHSQHSKRLKQAASPSHKQQHGNCMQ
jgi:hypothetical protein